MAKDPAFLFYPGDYLRDTQCLSEQSQVAYDRIMCEHMRNICITQTQLDFFTKRLNEEQRIEILMVLTKINGGYQITWVAESIEKRRNYSDSRRENRKGNKKNLKDISETYDSHMENENEIVIEIEDKEETEKPKKFIFKNAMVEYGFNGDLVDEWLLVRKNKKATNSETAFKGFVSEVEKRSCNLNDILKIIIEKSWAGFKWQWIDNLNTSVNGKQGTTGNDKAGKWANHFAKRAGTGT
jgi:hypothetical protein